LVLKLKYTAFEFFKLIKKNKSKNYANFWINIKSIIKYNLNSCQYLNYEEIFDLENQFNVKSYWNFYSSTSRLKFSPVELLIDPSYRLKSKKIIAFLDFLNDKDLEIGLHQGFHSWKSYKRMHREKKSLELVTKKNIVSCRQHWLNFSLKDTWRIQESLGFQLDMTLGFNDRIGFRNSAALKIPAWLSNQQSWSPILKTVPMVLMDSHLFDYEQNDHIQRRKRIDNLLDEISFVGGYASVIWHTHGFSKEYGWKDDYIYLLDAIKKRGILTND
jgi:hypothetical protein